MAKVINPMIENSKDSSIVFSKRNAGDGYTHNVRAKGVVKERRKK